MEPEKHSHQDGPDTLIWRMAADALTLASNTASGLVRACSVHPEAQPIAQRRIDTLREFATMLLHSTGELQEQLDGTGQIGQFDQIVDGFWDASADVDTGEAA